MFDPQPLPPDWVIWASPLIALGIVVISLFWILGRNLITIVHEGGHALVALLVGRKLRGIRLHSDTSGVTVSAGKPTGFGMVLTMFAGYIAPSLLGLACVGLLATDRITLVLVAWIVLLLGILVVIRNVYGVFSLLVTGSIFGATVFFGSDTAQAVLAWCATWFLLIGGVRPVLELQHKRRWGEAHNSDADQLAQLTRVPGLVWVLLFVLVTLACLGTGMAALLPSAGQN